MRGHIACQQLTETFCTDLLQIAPTMHEVLEEPGRSASQDRHELTAAVLLNPLHGAAVAEPRPVCSMQSRCAVLSGALADAEHDVEVAGARQADDITGGEL